MAFTRKTVLYGAAIVAVVGICAVAADEEDEPGSVETRAEPAASVDWENHSPAVKQRIDDMGAAGDCNGLQNEFDVADMNDDAQRDRTGDGNADLMGYIDDRLRAAGCYD